MIEKLLAYQTADKDAREIEKTLSESVEIKKYAVAKKYLESVAENVNKLDDRAQDLIAAYEQAVGAQLKLKEQEQELVAALGESEDENAVAFLLKKVEELIGKIKLLGKKAEQIEGEIATINQEYKAIKSKTKAAQAQYEEYRPKASEIKKELKAKKDAVDVELEKLKKGIDGELMERYLKKRAGKMYPILFEILDNKRCGACRMELSTADVDKLKKGEVIECGNCGRLLYQAPKK